MLLLRFVVAPQCFTDLRFIALISCDMLPNCGPETTQQVKKALGVPAGQARWSPCNYVTSLDFARSGDWLQSTNGLVAKMLERGVAVLAYSGDPPLAFPIGKDKHWNLMRSCFSGFS